MYARIDSEFDNDVSVTLCEENGNTLFYSIPTKDMAEIRRVINTVRPVLTKIIISPEFTAKVRAGVDLAQRLNQLLVRNAEEHLKDAPKLSPVADVMSRPHDAGS